MNLSIYSTELIYLLLGPGILVIVALLYRLDLNLRARCVDLEARLAETEGRLSVLQSRLSDDSRDLESRMALLTQQHEQLVLRESEAGPYFRAVRYAENGAGVEALIEQTGVTRAEAELIVSLHGKFRADQSGKPAS
jgi:hypothetical protein